MQPSTSSAKGDTRLSLLGLKLPISLPTNRAARQRRILTVMRTTSQLGFFGFMAYVATWHQIAPLGKDKPPTVEAFCPFGGVESLITLVTTGQMLQRTFTSTLVVFLALVAMSLVAGPAFCGWVCPFGAAQEWLRKLGRLLFKRRLVLPAKVDRPLRYLRYVLLIWLLVGSGYYGTLIFREYDPFLAFAHLMSADLFAEGIKFSFVALMATFVLSLFVERPFCRYFCPLGGLIDLLSKVGLVQIARKPKVCISCGACDKACPVDLAVSTSKGTPTGCISCLHCVAACPKAGALPLTVESLKARL